MCDVRKKLILTNVVIEKYKTWQINEKGIDKDKVFDNFSTTLLMKLLYLSCLFSIKNTNAKTYRNTPFGTLDEWIALPNGPAEDGLYSAIGYQPMPTISYNLGKEDGYKYSEEINDKSHINKINRYYYDDVAEIKIEDNILEKLISDFDLSNARRDIEQGFDTLFNEIGNKIDTSTLEKSNRTIGYLSRLTHLFLWNAALYRDTRTLATDNIYLLNDELNELDGILVEAK